MPTPTSSSRGLRDGLAGANGMLTDAEMQSTMQEFQKQVQAQQEAKQKVVGEKNKTEGEAFLAKNKARAGVKTTASGLQYEVEKEGTGPTPKATDTVTVNYKGTLMDGSTFDSSYDRGQPATFVLNQVIPGWTEGVQLMKVGSKYKFYIPAALGYGDKGAGATIGPNAPLVFEVELLSIGEPKAAPGAPAAEADGRARSRRAGKARFQNAFVGAPLCGRPFRQRTPTPLVAPPRCPPAPSPSARDGCGRTGRRSAGRTVRAGASGSDRPAGGR